MSDNPKEVEREMEKAIFISADCWLCVFDLLPPSQLGLGIAMISRRFDRFVDEHFKTRKWTLDKLEIDGRKTNEMGIVNCEGKALPIPQIPLPNKVMGFRSIEIIYFDQNVLNFLRNFHRFFALCSTNMVIATENVHISEFVVLNIWPMFKDTIREMVFHSVAFRQMRQFAPSILCNCPSLRSVQFDDPLKFPPDDSANASDGQSMAKWLFSPRPDNLPKMLTIMNSAVDEWPSNVEQIKVAFSFASSPVPFIIFIEFLPSDSYSAVVPFELTNQLTGEKLALSKEDDNSFSLIRCPIAEGSEKKLAKEINQMFTRKNKFGIFIIDGGVDKSLLDDLPGPSGAIRNSKK